MRPPDDPTRVKPISGVRPYVQDTRNILLLRVPHIEGDADRFLTTLAYALQRGIQLVYQVEEGEVAVELIGEGEQQRLLLWEAAEGGTGVWERIVGDPQSFATVAREALRVCHFDGQTGEEDTAWTDQCAVACYDCLLSYSNQPFHPSLNRHLIRNILLQLTTAQLVAGPTAEDRDDRLQRLLGTVDPASPLERDFLLFLGQHGLRLPDTAQNRPAPEIAVQPDFYYGRRNRPGVCVFIDGAVHNQPELAAHDRQVRDDLEDRGFRVVTIAGSNFAGGVAAHADVFGMPATAPRTPPVGDSVTVPQTDGARPIEELLGRGESETLEFKSSLRLGVPSGVVEPVVEKSILKTIAAFLNSYQGGTLIIGMEDNHHVLGIEYDFPSLKKGDLDSYELHLRNLLNREFGGDSAPLLEIVLHPIGDRHVCEVRVKPGRRAFMLIETGKDGQKKQQLYLRAGNQTVTLTMEEALRYAADRWPGK